MYQRAAFIREATTHADSIGNRYITALLSLFCRTVGMQIRSPVRVYARGSFRLYRHG